MIEGTIGIFLEAKLPQRRRAFRVLFVRHKKRQG